MKTQWISIYTQQNRRKTSKDKAMRWENSVELTSCYGMAEVLQFVCCCAVKIIMALAMSDFNQKYDTLFYQVKCLCGQGAIVIEAAIQYNQMHA